MSPLPLAFSPIVFLLSHIMAIVGILVVAGGLGVFGLSDLARFRFARVWAIADVCFAESIRRRVLWLVPLAVLGLVAVVQLQQPLDALDSIRQTTKFCLLTTGLVVVTSTLILACTNLPREIENKVIFTVVTKPTTRLEIVLGKIVGFARMSGTILILMGLFSFGYLHLRAWILQRDLQTRLDNGTVEKISQPTFEHYVKDGLLTAKTLGTPTDLNIYAVEPDPNSTRRYPVPGGSVLIKYVLPPPEQMLAVQDPDGTKSGVGWGMKIYIHAGYDVVPPKPGVVDRGGLMKQPPNLTVDVRDPGRFTAIGREINEGGKPFLIEDPSGNKPIVVTIPAAYVANLTKYPFIWIALTPSIGNHRIWIDDNPLQPPVTLVVPSFDAKGVPTLPKPIGPQTDPSGRHNITLYLGRDGQTGQQVAGDRDADTSDKTPVAIYSFHDTKITSGSGETTVPFEFKIGVEKSGESNDQDVTTVASIRFADPKSGYRSPPIHLSPENNRVSYGQAPIEAFKDGDFNVEVRCLSENQWLNITATHSLSVVKSVDSFAFNLGKACLILWLLSILVISISIFCSTFLSWPIAVVLTLVLLLGRWTLDELGDAATAGLGRTISTEFGFTDPTVSQTVSETVEHLNSTLKIVSIALPDISQFPTTDDIEQGISIPIASVLGGLGMMVAFGVPLTVLAYIFLKNKEVAP